MMKNQINYDIRTQVLYMVILSVLFDARFFGIIKLTENLYRLGALVCVFGSFFIILLTYGVTTRAKFLLTYDLVIIVFMYVQGSYTMAKYPAQSIVKFLQSAQGFAWIIFSYPILLAFLSEDKLEHLMDIIKKIMAFQFIFFLGCAFIYNNVDRSVISFLRFWYTSHRNGRLRVHDISTMEPIVAIWMFYEILRISKDRWKNIVALGVIMTSLVYIEQTRMMQLCLIASFAFMIFKIDFKSRNAKIMKLLVFLAVGIVLLLFGGNVLDSMLESFSKTGKNAGSTTVRLDEISTAWGLFIDHPLNGIGLMLNEVRDKYYLYKGDGQLGFTDIGFLGLLAQVGIWSFIIYIFPLFHFYNVIIRTPADDEYRLFYEGLFVYLLCSSMTLLVLNQPRIFAWPFFLAIFEFGSIRIQQKTNSVHQKQHR